MILLHHLQNRFFQFSMALRSILSAGVCLSQQELVQLGQHYRLDPLELGDTLAALTKNGLLETIPAAGNRVFYRTSGQSVASMPAGVTEREYLQHILRLPEAGLFLDGQLRAMLLEEGEDPFSRIRRLQPEPMEGVAEICPQDFQTVLQAIREKRQICYRYRTKASDVYVNASCVPWKLEHSVYDRRWWIILYDPEADRTIKAVLSNLCQVQLGAQHNVTEEQILAALDKLKEPEPVRLLVEDKRNALERCFLSFENREVLESRDLGDQRYVLAFSYYRFDTEEILRKLLYLGPAVTLVGPESLKEMLRSRIMQALE